MPVIRIPCQKWYDRPQYKELDTYKPIITNAEETRDVYFPDVQVAATLFILMKCPK